MSKRSEERREDVIFMYLNGEHIERISARSEFTLQTVKHIILDYERARARGEHAEEEVDGVLGVLRPLHPGEEGAVSEARPA